MILMCIFHFEDVVTTVNFSYSINIKSHVVGMLFFFNNNYCCVLQIVVRLCHDLYASHTTVLYKKEMSAHSNAK